MCFAVSIQIFLFPIKRIFVSVLEFCVPQFIIRWEVEWRKCSHAAVATKCVSMALMNFYGTTCILLSILTRENCSFFFCCVVTFHSHFLSFISHFICWVMPLQILKNEKKKTRKKWNKKLLTHFSIRRIKCFFIKAKSRCRFTALWRDARFIMMIDDDIIIRTKRIVEQ